MARNDVDDGDRWWVRFGRERKDHRAACRRLLAAYRRQVLGKQRWSGVGRCGRSAGGSLAGRARAGALPGTSLSQRRQSQLLRSPIERQDRHTLGSYRRVELRDSQGYLLGSTDSGIYLILEVLNLSRV